MDDLKERIKALDISIHAPRTGSDVWQTCLANGCQIFQSTLPARGATMQYFEENGRSVKFQSTLPARGATSACCACITSSAISIHAPRTGSDIEIRLLTSASATFQSTLPARGATTSSPP